MRRALGADRRSPRSAPGGPRPRRCGRGPAGPGRPAPRRASASWPPGPQSTSPELLGRDLRVVPDVAEEGLGDGPFSGQPPDLGVDHAPVADVAEQPAEEVLLDADAVHQRRRHLAGVLPQGAFDERGAGVPGHATGPDADEEQPVRAGGPAQPVLRQRRHQRELERRVVQRRRPAVAEHVLGAVAEDDALAGEVRRRGRARPDQLPQRDLEVRVGQRGVVEAGRGVAAQRPGGVGPGVAQPDHEQAPQVG